LRISGGGNLPNDLRKDEKEWITLETEMNGWN